MDKKLTLSLNQEVIEKAKLYAKSNNTSLSKMIEAYFESITNIETEKEVKTTPLVRSLTGVGLLPKGFDYKKSKGKYLIEKHQ